MENKDISVYVYGLGTSDYIDAAYDDFRKDKKVYLIDRHFRWLSPFRRVHISRKLERILRTPYRDTWARFDWQGVRVPSGEPSVIFFLECPEARCRSYVKWVRERFPHSFLCLNLLNPMNWRDMAGWTSEVCDLFDLVITCSKNDAYEFGFAYWPDCYSETCANSSGALTSDICFIGRDKGRAEFVWDVFQAATSSGLKCDFIIYGDKRGMPQRDGFRYLRTKSQMPYADYLKHVMSARALLEVLFASQDYSSLRTMESLVYGKHLVTTNKKALEEPIADASQIHIVDNPTQVIDVLKEGLLDLRPSKEAAAFYSPLRLVNYLRERSQQVS